MIQVRGLEKRFGSVKALDGVSFDVAAGETFALLGPNGSGKTTTLKCLAGLTLPTAGQIRINGIDLSGQQVGARSAISYLPQRVAFPEQVTAREVLDFYRRLRKLPPARVEAALEQCAFPDAADRYVSEFSGGMMQRLGIAVAILADAPILLLDEPTASLDPEGAAGFRSFLGSLKDLNKTIVFSSHVLSDVDLLADRVAILVGGRLRVVESIAALRNDLNTQSILRVQLRNTNKRFISVATAAGGADVACTTGGLTLFASPEERYRILRALEVAGAEVIGFSTVEPSLEDIYLRYIHADPFDLSAADRSELREPAAAAG
jgi:ABC-type multidrug transport system ATPase subunit